MLSPKFLFDKLSGAGVSLFAGVPDSLLKDFNAYVTDHAGDSHVITANEGSAVGLAMGHYMSTGKPAVVYMQNSGLGNTVNPLTSLADPAVYGIPMLLVVGWRGEPDKKDEPQHVQMGKVTCETLDAIGVPNTVLPDEEEAAGAVVDKALEEVTKRNGPYALVVKKGTFDKYSLKSGTESSYQVARERAIEMFVAGLPKNAVVVATTGMPSRELFEVRENRKEPHESDFLTVGGMGHASQIALGIARQTDRPVYCLDGDGAVLMHMGGLATIGSLAPKNYRHVVLNNGAHESVGGQPTVAFEVDLCAVARACQYRSAESVADEPAIQKAFEALHASEGPTLVEVRIKKGHRGDLGRPTMTPQDLKRAVMRFVGVS